ncbi:hypothetical protein KAX17_11075 [Candidatus Bipolaricaulota bacterium]|nr:hypothetical protein [Candidatus Bipolaricaulota bacterium]
MSFHSQLLLRPLGMAMMSNVAGPGLPFVTMLATTPRTRAQLSHLDIETC